jgi:hypothetical protein
LITASGRLVAAARAAATMVAVAPTLEARPQLSRSVLAICTPSMVVLNPRQAPMGHAFAITLSELLQDADRVL